MCKNRFLYHRLHYCVQVLLFVPLPSSALNSPLRARTSPSLFSPHNILWMQLDLPLLATDMAPQGRKEVKNLGNTYKCTSSRHLCHTMLLRCLAHSRCSINACRVQSDVKAETLFAQAGLEIPEHHALGSWPLFLWLLLQGSVLTFQVVSRFNEAVKPRG